MMQTKFEKFISCSSLISILSAVILASGCHSNDEPRLRFGAFFGSPIGMNFAQVEHLGTHHYEFTLNEKNGMLYTCKGGFIDIAHVREAADRTAYLQNITYQNLVQGNKTFTFHVIEPSQYWVTLSYPEDWNDYTEKEKRMIAREISIDLGQYLAHTSLIWHEIITWYGFATSGIFPDTISAFSPEDTYSDILGTWLATQALRDKRVTYDEAMTKLLYQTLEELEVQPAHVAHEAAKQIKGQWYKGGFYFFVDMKRRNLDVGFDDDMITPWLVPGICPDAEPRSWPAPHPETIRKYGFYFSVEIEPKIMEKEKIYNSIGLAKESRLKPKIDFPHIIDMIGKQENDSVISVAAR
jgi:hypothetical protein